MAIRAVEAWTLRLELQRPVEFGSMRYTHRDYAIVRVTDSSGAQGFGYGMARGAPVAATVGSLAPLILGEDPASSDRLWETMYRVSIPFGQRGIALRSLSLIDIALWDLRAREAGLALHRMFGSRGDEVAVSVGGAYFRESRPEDEISAELADYVKRGFKHVKIPAGGWTPAEEEAWIGSARQAVGPDIALAVDAHWTWSDVRAARAVVERWDQFGLDWVEDPLWPEAVASMAELRRTVGTPIAVGDEQSGRWAYQNLLIAQAADIWRVDAATVGGFSEFRRVAAIASAWGVPISTHIYPELHVHCAASESAVIGVEYVDPEADIDLAHRFIHPAAVVRDGRMQAPEGPGLGFELDWELIESQAVETLRW